ncbi:MAG: purine-nucleoside phosphorylase [Planctomycetaceae bacterium]|nr:purine-nucleoside phosphorylase [Planctomycetaceae bacterium]
MVRRIDAAVATIRERWSPVPRMGIILGTGLGNFTEEIAADAVIPYDEIPFFPKSTAIGHAGQLVCGTLRGLPVVTMEGRFHVYEGYPAWQITLPVRVMHALGATVMVVSNAAGAVNPEYRTGDVMAIEDHINLMGVNPLTGPTNDTLGNRFPDMSRPYDSDFIEQAQSIAREQGFGCHRGVYVALSGPNYETRAEYRFLRKIGGDVIGMSTVPEVIVAHQLGVRVLALSTVTNVCLPDALGETDGEEVVAAASSAERKLRAIVLGVTEQLKGR